MWFRRNVRLLIFFIVSLSLTLVVTYALFPARLLLIPLLLLIGLVLSGILAVLGWSALFQLARSGVPWRGVTRFAVPLVVVIITLATSAVYIRTLGVKYINPSDFERDVYQFVASLPKETVLAGNPHLMEGIPLFSKRSVLFRDLFPRADAPIVEYFDAQYAETAQTTLDFCQRYQISYLVLDTRDFDPNYLAEGNFFYQPWNDEIVKSIADRSNFILPELQPVFASGPLRVIKCDAETLLVENPSK